MGSDDGLSPPPDGLLDSDRNRGAVCRFKIYLDFYILVWDGVLAHHIGSLDFLGRVPERDHVRNNPARIPRNISATIGRYSGIAAAVIRADDE